MFLVCCLRQLLRKPCISGVARCDDRITPAPFTENFPADVFVANPVSRSSSTLNDRVYRSQANRLFNDGVDNAEIVGTLIAVPAQPSYQVHVNRVKYLYRCSIVNVPEPAAGHVGG